MTTIVRRLPSAATGVDALPLFLPSVGLPGVTHRWRAQDVAAAHGAAVTTMTDVAGSVPLIQATAANQPTMHIAGGVRSVRFDGTNDKVKTQTNPAAGTVRSVVVLARVNGVVDQGIVMTGLAALRYRTVTTPDEVYGFWVGAAGSQKIHTAPTGTFAGDGLFHTFVFAGDGTTFRIMADGLLATQAAAGTAPFAEPNQYVELGVSGASLFGQIDVLEAFTFGTVLSTGDRDAIRAAAQTNYPGLVA